MLEAIHNENVFNFFSENKMDTEFQKRQKKKKNGLQLLALVVPNL